MSTKIICRGRTATPTTHGVTRGIDVSFEITVRDEDGGVETLRGGATMAPRQFDGAMAPYGSAADMWLDGRTLARLQDLSTRDFREALDAIEVACAPLAEEARDGTMSRPLTGGRAAGKRRRY